MRVQVDKSGRHNASRGIQNAVGGLPFQAADLGDFAALDRKVADIAWRARSINNRAAFDDNVVI
jgi:glucose dehydrogenase